MMYRLKRDIRKCITQPDCFRCMEELPEFIADWAYEHNKERIDRTIENCQVKAISLVKVTEGG